WRAIADWRLFPAPAWSIRTVRGVGLATRRGRASLGGTGCRVPRSERLEAEGGMAEERVYEHEGNAHVQPVVAARQVLSRIVNERIVQLSDDGGAGLAVVCE